MTYNDLQTLHGKNVPRKKKESYDSPVVKKKSKSIRKVHDYIESNKEIDLPMAMRYRMSKQ